MTRISNNYLSFLSSLVRNSEPSSPDLGKGGSLYKVSCLTHIWGKHQDVQFPASQYWILRGCWTEEGALIVSVLPGFPYYRDCFLLVESTSSFKKTPKSSHLPNTSSLGFHILLTRAGGGPGCDQKTQSQVLGIPLQPQTTQLAGWRWASHLGTALLDPDAGGRRRRVLLSTARPGQAEPLLPQANQLKALAKPV